MKRLFLFALVLLIIAACNLEEEPVYPSIQLSAPEGFEITYVGSVGYDGDLKQLQMLDETVGYILVEKSSGRDYVSVLKTEDGGKSWTDLNVKVWPNSGSSVAGQAESMYFFDTEIGIVTYEIGDKVNILRTTTGGENWRHYEFVEYEGAIKRTRVDGAGNLYGLLSDEYNNATVLKSYDKGLSWKALDTSRNFYFSPFVFSFQAFGDKLYVSGFGASVFELDTAGHFLREINTNYSTLRKLAIVDENSFLATSTGVSVSNDGENWEEVNNAFPYLIGVNSPNEFFMIFSKTASPVADDVFAVTTDGGNTWLESKEPFKSIGADFIDSQKLCDKHYLVLIGHELYEIRER